MKNLSNFLSKSITRLLFLTSFLGIINIANSQTTGKSLAFDGVDDYIDLGGDNNFGTVSNFTGDFTFEAWVYNDGSSTWARVFDFGDSTNDYIIFTVKSSDTGECRFEYRTGGGAKYKIDGGVFPTGVWTHVACRLSASGDATILLNGVVGDNVGTGWPGISNIIGTTKNYLGKSQFNDPYFKGKMKEVRVWKEYRSAALINDWMNCEISGTEPNLIGYYKLDEGIVGANNNAFDFHVQNFGVLSFYDGVLKNFALTGSNSNWVGDNPSTFSEDPAEKNVIEFSNRNDAFILNNESNFDFASEYTVEYWLFPNFNWNINQISLIKGGGGVLSFYSDHGDGKVFFGQRLASGIQEWATATGLEYNKWTHISLTAKEENGGITNKIYFDGVLKATHFQANAQIPQTNEKVKLGSAGWFKMANVRFWDKALDAAEIAPNISTIYPQGTPNLISQYVQYDNYAAGLVDNIGSNDGIRNATPIFSNDPCFVQFTQEPQDAQLPNFATAINLTANIKYCNDANFSYQWQKDGIDISGATSLSYSNNSPTANDLGTYQLIVTACGQTFPTRKATITVANQGKVLHFDGIDDYISFSDNTGNVGYTVEARIRFDEDPVNQSIIVNTDANESKISGQLVVNAEGYLQHNMWDPTTLQMKSSTHPTKVRAHKWYNVELHYNEVYVWIEIDDVLSPQIPTAGNTSILPTWYLGKSVGNFDAFKGELDEVRIWNVNQSTILNDVTVGANVNLVDYFQFNEGIAEANNASPILVNTVVDPYTGSVATLHNFDLTGSQSNWLGCDRYDNDVSITMQSNQQVTVGNQLTLYAIINGADGTETYQWYKDGVAIDGATDSVYQKNTTLADDGRYQLEVGRFNSCNTFSDAVEVFIKGTGEVLHFDGVNDHIIIPSGNYYSGSYTVECWVKFDDEVSNQSIIVATGDNGPYNENTNQLFTDTEGYFVHSTFLPSSGTTSNVKALAPAMPNTWYHVAIRANNGGNGMQLLINGVVQGSATTNTNLWTGVKAWYIGSSARALDAGNITLKDNFKGEMDDLRIWRTYVSDSRIQSEKDDELDGSPLYVGLDYYLKFNQGAANGDNTNVINSSRIPNYENLASSIPSVLDAEYVNFDFEGEESNFKECSPITKPELEYNLSQASGLGLYVGQSLEFDLEIETGDTSLLSFQWIFDGQEIEGANEPIYSIESMTEDDFGTYQVAIEDMCSPVFYDTITVPYIPTTNTCYTNYSNPTNYPDSTRYIFCNGSEGETNLCFEPRELGGFKTDYGYCGTETLYEGEEIVFHISLTEPQVVDLTLQNIQADVDMWVFGDDCDLDNCLASSLELGLQDEFIRVALPAGDFYVLIDEKEYFEFTAGNDSLVLDIQMYDNKCSFSQPIACDDEVSGVTTDGSNFIDDYDEFIGYTSTEQVYELVVTDPVTINATLSGLSSDLDLFLLDSTCIENNLLVSSRQVDSSDDMISYGVQPGTYYIIVDGKDGASGSFDLSVTCANYFDASVDETDAYIDLNWSIDKKACVPQDTGIIVRLITTPNTILFEEEYTTAALTPDVITGTFRHIVGDNHERMYVLRVYNRLSNATLCNEVKTGSTLPFQVPEILSISQADAPDSIKIEWRNHSQLSDEFRIYRDGSQIASLIDGYTEDSLIVSYVDRHDMNNNSSIYEAQTYNYCIETHSTSVNNTYSQVCGTGATYDINFQASDGGTTDKVALTWNDVSPFSDGIIIWRNGIQLSMLSANETFYNDMSPIYGVTSEYKMTILRQGDEKIVVVDNGYVEPNGVISGRVVYDEGGYPVQDVTITLSKDTTILNVVSQIEVETVVTDFEGKFQFDDVVYELANNFKVVATKNGSDISPEEITFELNGAIPAATDLLFTDNSDVIVTVGSLLDTLFLDEQELEDLVVVNWDYTYSATETMHFLIKRNGELIFEGNDSNGKITSFTDLTGVPGFAYSYVIDGFRFDGDDIESEMKSMSGTYPELTPVIGFDFTLDGEMQIPSGEMVGPQITFDWSAENHPSQNFDGFRIFRNNILLAEVSANSSEMHSVIVPPAIEAGYEMRTFRKINGATYESAPFPANADTMITALPLWEATVYDDPFAFPPPSGRAIILDASSFINPYEFYADGIYTGIILERKLQSASDDTYVEVESLTKQFIAGQVDAQLFPQIWDAYGIPNTDYTYKLSTYLDLDGVRYKRETIFDRTCPEITGPSNIQKIEEVGKVGLTWTDNSIEEGLLSQLYFNYSGYELTRTDITNLGEEELIATLPGSTESYNDFIVNKVFNLFSNSYIHIDYNYQLKAFFDIDGVRYYSAPLSINAAPDDGSTIEPLPTDFVASDNIPGHIKLCWDWTATKQSEFIIYRDTLAIDTLPSTARAYYDYDAPSDPNVLYKITSIFNGVESEAVLAEGRMPSNMDIHGRISNVFSGSGLEGVNVIYRNTGNSSLGISYGEFAGSALTDPTGSYSFADIPHTPGLQYQVKVFSNNVDFNSDEFLFQAYDSEFLTINSGRDYTVDFLEYSIPEVIEEVTPISSVIATPHADSMFVEIMWSPEHGYYDGFQIYRVNQLLGEVKKGEGFSFIDRGGFPGIDYVYTVRSYKSEEGGRDFSAHAADRATYPSILPVENLTVTAFAEMNKMLVSWSHPLDNHDSYRVRRNGEFMVNIPAGETLMWYDESGIPGLTYQYEVTAINGANISEPVVVTKAYKGVGEARNLAVEINEFEQACSGVLTNDNHITISWEYNPGAAQGFEIYRDDVLIAEIDSIVMSFGSQPLAIGDTLMSGYFAHYDDYDGVPGVMHSYHVLPYVIRADNRYASGIEELYLEEELIYPQLAEVSNIDIAQNNIFGSAEINFSYSPMIVQAFEVLRDGAVIDTIVAHNEESYTYQDFTGLPGQSYNYAVRPYDFRSGVAYQGSVACNETIIFPIVPTPQNFTASQGTFENHIELDWDFSLEAFVDSFYLENITLNTLEVFGAGKRSFIEVINDFEDSKYEYRIRASRINQNQTIYSEWSEIMEGWSSRQISGGEEEELSGDVLATLNGYSSDIDGDWAVSGAPNGLESIFIYRRVNGGWSLFQTIPSPDSKEDSNFGLAVAISGTTIIAGAPLSGSNGAAYIYEFDGDQWDEIPQVINPGISGNFGWSVDIDGDDIIVGNPLNGSQDHGYIHWYERQSDGLWIANGAIAGNTQLGNTDVRRFGYGVAIDDGYSVASWNRPSANFSEAVGYVKNSNGDWVFSNYSGGIATYLSGLIQDNLDYNDGVLAFGDYFSNGRIGRVFIRELVNNVFVNPVEIVGPYGVNSDFGFSVAVQKIESPVDDAIYLAVGSRLADVNSSANGIADLYSNVNGSFEQIDEIVNVDATVEEYTGWSVSLSKDAWGVGTIRDYNLNNGSFVLENLLSAPSNVEATDGISIDFDPTETTISWEFDGNYDLLAGFNIYRDEEFLTYRDKATMTIVGQGIYADNWNDNSGEAGLPYVYSVKSVNNLVPFESYGTSEEGYNRADGKIIGAVKTQMGLVPVPGVTITATGIVKGEVYTYTTITQPNGEYIFSTVYYDPDETVLTEYTVTAEYLDHQIIPQTTEIAYLNPLSDPSQGVVDFFDVTAYVIRGNVAQPGIMCPLEGIKVTQVINGSPAVGLEAFTDAEGNYSLVVNPFESGLQEITVRIDQQLTVDEVTTTYDFQPVSDTTFTDFSSFPIVTDLDYVDALTYDVSLKVKNTCNDAISNGKWSVRVRTLDGCFDEEFVTNTNGDLIVPLIPQNYTMKVVGVDIQNALNQQALDYYANFPVSLNLLDLHQDSIETLSKVEIEEIAARQFTFHKAAEIEVIGFNDVICNTQTAILQQEVPYTLSFDVFETHNGNSCSVEEGIIVVNNPAAADSDPVTIQYNDVLEKFDDYSFVAGGPQQIFPHAYAVTFDYKTVDGIFLGRKTRVVFVEGSISVPGTDIIVDPASGNDAVPYPLLVLRDPPGDQSSSYIAAEQTISFETEMSVENELGAKLYTEISTEVFGQGVDIEANINGGYTSEETISMSNSVTTSTQISTSDDEDNIGRGADIIVGTGMVMQFGNILEFKVNPDTCSAILKVHKYGISPNAATTTWSYQVGQVEDIIQGYKNDSLKVEINELVIERGGVPLSKDDAITFLNSNINNWNQILHYHDVETVPHYYLCTVNPYAVGSGEHATQIGYWQAQIRPLFVDLVNGEYILKDDFEWTDQVIDIYNAASAAIRNLIQGGDLSIWSFPYTGNPNNVDLNQPLPNFDLVDFAFTISQPSLTDYTANFGAQVKNITTGGNILIEESINNAQASTTSISNSIYLGSELDIAATFGGSSEIVVGTFAGVGGGVTFATVTELFETEYKVGAALETTFTRSNSYSGSLEESVEVGYSIFDDDNIDAFSFAVIQAVTPNSTPYFDYFGGHTSCPPEDGSVFVDVPKMAFVIGGGTDQSQELFNVPADEAAVYQVIAENQSLVASQPTRELEISLESGSNPGGAIVTLNGVSLNNSSYIDSFAVGEPLELVLNIERGPVEYDYTDIQIGIEPTCGEGPREFIYASAYFVNPCSPVTLVSPIENWVINDDTTKLVITMQDYDPFNPFLVDATVQYRRIGTGDDWTDIPGLELEKGNFISADSLIANDAEYAEGQIEKYFFIWTIPTTEGAYPDGDYEVRTKMTCDNFSSTLSNVISGKIARDGLNLFGNPQPADQIWTAGDEISFSFNNDLDCALMTESFIEGNVSVYNETTGVEEPFTLSCYANKVIFVMDSLMSKYDGEFLTINVDNVPSIEGNISQSHSWTFRVITQKVYWADADTVKLRMYQDDIESLTINLENSTLNETISNLTFATADGGFGDWLTITDPMTQPFAVNPSGRAITFEVDASEPVGIYNETVNVLGVEAFGNVPQVHIQLEVLVKPPNWVVDPGDYSNSMNMIGNWRYTTDDADVVSTDVADLISVWVGNEIRGVAPITESGEFYASYLTIYGNPEDGNDTELEFRIWDADLGIEYDGQPTDTIFYVANSTRGTTANPEVLIVDAEYDRARYIFLRQGWTGFSLADSTTNMSVAHKLRTLGSVTDGDLIVTGDKFSQYTDSIGWFNFGASNLATLDNNEGYMIYLDNGPDTLRVTGTAPSTNDIQLKSGWNWLGFPFENAEEVNDVLNLNAANSTGDDRIKIDFPLPGEVAKFANYDIAGDNWNDGDLDNMEPYNLYKLYSGHPNGAILSWTPQNNIKDEDSEELARMGVVVDPDDFTTWVMPDFDTDNVMPVIGEVIIGGIASSDPNDWVAFFEADTIRALGSIEYIEALGVYEVSMLAEKSASNYDIRFYDASEGVILQATNILGFDINGVGNVFNPYEIIFEEDPCPEVLLLGPTGSPFVLDKTFEASEEIRVLGNLNIPANVNIILSAPKVTIVDQLNTGDGAQVIVRPDGCN